MTNEKERTTLGFEPHPDPEKADQIGRVLCDWLGTAYAKNREAKGVAADCRGFAVRALDEIHGVKGRDLPKVANDVGLHDRKASLQAMREILRAYEPVEDVTEGKTVRPGDVVVEEHPGGGPGHLLVCGADGFLYQAINRQGVVRSGRTLLRRLCRIYRPVR